MVECFCTEIVSSIIMPLAELYVLLSFLTEFLLEKCLLQFDGAQGSYFKAMRQVTLREATSQ